MYPVRRCGGEGLYQGIFVLNFVEAACQRIEMRVMKKTLKPFFLAVLAGLSLTIPVAGALADLMIMPVRVVFQAHDRTANVTLVNVANHKETYRLSWMYQKQKEDGS